MREDANEDIHQTHAEAITTLAEDLYAFKDWDIGEYSENAEMNRRIWQKYPGF